MSEEIVNNPLTDEVSPITGAEIEAAMVKKESEKEPHALDNYAGFFQMYSPVFNVGLERLGKKALIRVMKMLIQYPLEETHLKALNKAEKDLLKIGDQLLVSKYLMMIHSMQEAALKAEEKEKENVGTEEKKS